MRLHRRSCLIRPLLMITLLVGLMLAGCAALDRPSVVQWAFGEHCDGERGLAPAAGYNAAAETNLTFSPFGRAEIGWATYTPRLRQTLRTRCDVADPGFARVVARWQASHGLNANGALTAETFQTLKGDWQARRPFVMLRVKGICPDGADEGRLVALSPQDAISGKSIRLRPAALAALRKMTQAARLDVRETSVDPNLLKAFSGYRSPAADAARCETEQNCQGVARAMCSAHRTGLAVDLDVGAAAGFALDSSEDLNRRFQSRTATYHWLVRHAAGFGFVNYAFEPWHWEWIGEAP
jgi:D-alanyl-D-alanine carboxypeptidase